VVKRRPCCAAGQADDTACANRLGERRLGRLRQENADALAARNAASGEAVGELIRERF